ncbi:hypothetical protein LguiB_024613 [Lonicera macranthoides]
MPSTHHHHTSVTTPVPPTPLQKPSSSISSIFGTKRGTPLSVTTFSLLILLVFVY